MAFQKTFDELLEELLTDWRNQFPEADTAQGSLIYIKCAALASALWGLYKYLDHISRQIFPDTADSANMEHHAWVRGLTRRPGESDADLLVRLLDYIRRPPAGGNKYDYVKWALSVPGVKSAWCFPLANGLGTVDVVIAADPASGSEIPDQDLLDAVLAYIDDVRPVTAWGTRVLAPELLPINVSLTVTGATANRGQTATDIIAYMSGLSPGQPLYLAQLINLAVINGAESVVISAPGGTITPLNTQLIRPGVVNVT
jgi:uncharacterized phage protein gp47/JayE